ncbi:MAG: tetratricopeptide repeat protein [Planctomycetota bacterium]
MQLPCNSLISVASAKRNTRLRGCTGALLALAVLNAATEVSAQRIGNSPSMSFGSAPQPAGKWYSKLVPWKQSAATPQFKMSPQREITNVEEPSEAVKSEGQLSFARLAERRGQPDQARAIYEAFVKKQSDNPLPFHRLGVMAAKKGDFEQCDHYLSKAFHLDQNNPNLLADIGYSMYLRGLTADAETFYRRALELDRDHEAAANNLAMLMVETGRPAESLALFKRVNDEAEAYSNQGYVLAQTGELEEAKKYFNHALTLDTTLTKAATGMLQVANYQEKVRTAPEFARARPPEQLVESPPAASTPQPEAVVESEPKTPENASLVVIQDAPRTLDAPRQPTPPAVEAPALSPPPVLFAEAEPAATPYISHTALVERAQDLSVREARKPNPIESSGHPQVVRPADDVRAPPPVIVRPATTAPHSWPDAAFSQVVRERPQPQAIPLSNIFSTRVSYLPEPKRTPPTQTVPESSMPVTQTDARTRWGGNPVRAAAMNVETQQLGHPMTSDTTNWLEQAQSNLALKSILPPSQFQAPPMASKMPEPIKLLSTPSDDRN